MSKWKDKTVLVTGGTGSFGRAFAKYVLDNCGPEKLIIFSRDELKQYDMQQQFSLYKNIRFFIGDVRDKQRLSMALRGVDYVIHAAALKQVPLMEYNPAEAIKTNIIGAMNLIEAAIENKIKKVIALSTDKACNPVNLYGATKLCSDKLFVAGNSYSGENGVKFSIVRYGNVVGSRGSVVPLFLQKKPEGVLPITDRRMTRFWITIEQAVKFVVMVFEKMNGGEIFVPKIPSMNIMDLAQAIAPECRTEVVGIRPGEKLHEIMISENDARNTKELRDCYVILPSFPWWDSLNHREGKSVPSGFRFSSNNNCLWLTARQIREMIKKI